MPRLLPHRDRWRREIRIGEGADRDGEKDAGENGAGLGLAEEIVVRGFDEVEESQLAQETGVQAPAEKHAGAEDCREHRGDQTDGEGQGEAFHAAAGHRDQDDAGDQGGEVCIEDG